MKKTFKYILSVIALAGSMVACSPEEFAGMEESGIPSVESYSSAIRVNADQSLNQVTFTLDNAQGVYPIWVIESGKNTTRSTLNGYKQIFTVAGEYTVKCYIGNRNGISDQYVEKTFTIENSIVDFTKYFTLVSKAPWYLDNTAKGHLACGPNAGDPTGWWSAGPDEKAAFGVYDNCLTYTADKVYTFDPGQAGTIYVNKGTTLWGSGAEEDFCVEAQAQTSSYNFEVSGEDLYLTLGANTYFPYIAFDAQYTSPRYKVVNLTAKQMTLVVETDGIAWQYILTTQHEVKEEFNGFDVNSADNLWKQANPSFLSLYYAHTSSWEGLPDYEHSEENGVITIELPTQSDAQWQAQYHMTTDLTNDIVPAGATYDFSVIVTPTNDIAGATFKLTQDGDDSNFLFEERVDLVGLEDNVVYFTEREGKDLAGGKYKMVLDFGGNPDNTTIVIKDFVLIDHTKNQINPPSGGDDPDPEIPEVNWVDNMLEGMNVEISYYYAPGWSQIANPVTTIEGNSYTVELPAATTDQWQSQFTFNNTGIALDPAKTYDFRVKVLSTTDHGGITVKLTQQDNDDVYITADRHAVNAFEETWIVLPALAFNKPDGTIDNLKIVYDFGGNAEGTEITISDMQLQEHQGPKVINWDLTGEKNLWLKGEHPTLSYYYAPGWSQIADPETDVDGNSFTIKLPEATSDQWQAQWHIGTDLGSADIKADKLYNIRFTLYSDADQPGVTFKFTENGNDDNFLTADRHSCTAYEEKVIELTGLSLSGDITNPTFKLVLDFAGNPAGCEVTVKDIIIQEDE